jgi:hypothetical protein
MPPKQSQSFLGKRKTPNQDQEKDKPFMSEQKPPNKTKSLQLSQVSSIAAMYGQKYEVQAGMSQSTSP